MKKITNKKGFTIVELVIVIAVIAILAAVMIPTFSNVIEKANASAVQQVAAALYKEAYALDLSDGKLDGNDNTQTTTKEINKMTIDNVKGNDVKYDTDPKYFEYNVSNGTFTSFSYTDTDKGYTATFNGTTWTTEKNSTT